MVEQLKQCKELFDAGDIGPAWVKLDELWSENINDAKPMVLASYFLDKMGRHPLAYHLSKRIVELYPKDSAGWTNLGKQCDELWRAEESERAYLNALKKCNVDRHKVVSLVSLAALYLQIGEFEKAKGYSEQALKLEPDNRKAKHNLGISLLAAKDWAKGWECYANSLGTDHRRLWKYNDEPEWRGEKGTVVIYGEQGIGDEINSASMFADAVATGARVILDCDSRLVGIYRRSFPSAHVYGTRSAQVLNWAEEDRKVDFSISSMQLGGLFRNKPEDFPGTPYLVADPDRVLMWRALFETKKKPVIGVSWTGGVRGTGAKFRKWSLDDLLPVFRSIDAHFVSLQYKDAAAEIEAFKKKHPEIDLVHYPHATLTKDYDDTAAIVYACDRVIAMQTAVVHLAGALGKQCDVFVPKNSQWRYAGSDDFTPWYQSVKVHRQTTRGHWSNTIKDFAETLRAD